LLLFLFIYSLILFQNPHTGIHPIDVEAVKE